MATHCVAYQKSAIGGTFSAYTPVPDPTLTINDTAIQVPATYNKVVRTALLGGASATTHSELQAPSLRSLYFPDFSRFVTGMSVDNPEEFNDMDDNPLQLVTNEGLQFFADGGGATAAETYGILFFSDSPIAQAKGQYRTIRATTAITAAADAWNSGAITFDQTLPVGTYDILGMRVEAAGLAAARLIFIGQSAATRPGVLCQSAAGVPGTPKFRTGMFGVLGSFPSTNPPSLEVVGGATTAQVVYLDLVKRS